MSIGLQITSRLRCKKITEVFRKNFTNCIFSRVASESFAAGCSYFFQSKLSQLTHLMSMVFFYTLLKLWFFMFSGSIKRRVSWNVLRSIFFCVDNFWSVNLECEKISVQKASKIKKQKGSKIKIGKGSSIRIQNSFTIKIRYSSTIKIQNRSTIKIQNFSTMKIQNSSTL